MPKVSVIIPCYGVEKYLDRCMESVVNQTLKDIEIILVDDGSPDRVPEMCDEWAKKDSRIKVIHKENGGLGYARNSGLEIATGEYVAFVDSDDFIDITMYEKLYQESEEAKYDVIFCGYNTFQNGIIKEQKSTANSWNKSNIDKLIADMTCANFSVRVYTTEYNMSVWHAIYRSSIFNEKHIKFRSERDVLSEDIVFDYEYLRECHNVKHINLPLYYYCYNSTSLSHTFKASKIYKVAKLYNILFELSEPLNSDVIKERLLRFFFLYHENNFRMMLLSNRKWSDKLKLSQDIYNDVTWNELKETIKHRDMPFLNRIKFYFLDGRHTLSAFLYYKLLFKLGRAV